MLMPLRKSGTLAAPAWLCRATAAILIFGAAAAHLGFMLYHCPLDLAPDEAHYWDWSRHLDWSYYSKGPLVAWLIRASCELAGPWAVEWTGTLMPALRLPAVTCGALLLLSLYVLTQQVTRRDGLALAVVGLALTMPMLAAGSSLMTIDAPYTCCWGWALVLAHRAVFRGSAWAWPLAGLVVGIGILAKYTMVVFLPSLGLFLLATPTFRRLLLRPGFWIMGVVAGLCCLPILIWNIQNGWVTFKHVKALSGGEGAGIHWLGPLAFVAGQFALLLGFWFVVWLCAMVRHNPLADADDGRRFLWWMSAPMFAMFLAFGLKTGGGELNWPVTAYLSGLILGAIWLARQLEAPTAWYRRATWAMLSIFTTLGLSLTLLIHRGDLLHPVLEGYVGAPKPGDPCPLRKVDPTCRLRGWRTLAAELDALREKLEAEGRDVVLASSTWAVPGELGFYCAGHPQAYSVGLLTGDRHSQYDLWTNPLDHADRFKGKDFIVVGDLSPKVSAGFQRVEQSQVIYHYENGRPLACWYVTVCRGFQGFPDITPAINHH